MNRKMIGKVLGFLLLMECIFLLPPALVSAIDGEWEALRSFFTVMAVAAAVGGGLSLLCRKAEASFYAREGFLIVGLG